MTHYTQSHMAQMEFRKMAETIHRNTNTIAGPLSQSKAQHNNLGFVNVDSNEAPVHAMFGEDRYCYICRYKMNPFEQGTIHSGCRPCDLCQKSPPKKVSIRVPFFPKKGWEVMKTARLKAAKREDGVDETVTPEELAHPDPVDLMWMPWTCKCVAEKFQSPATFLSQPDKCRILRATLKDASTNNELSAWEAESFFKEIRVDKEVLLDMLLGICDEAPSALINYHLIDGFASANYKHLNLTGMELLQKYKESKF